VRPQEYNVKYRYAEQVTQNQTFPEVCREQATFTILDMRLALAVNDRPIARASLVTKGWLGAHVSLSQGVESDELTNRVWLNSMDTSDDPNTEHSTWDAVGLNVGDRIEIEVLPDEESDPPNSVSRTLDNPNNLFSDVEQARLLLAAIKTCDTALWEVAEQARGAEPEDEFRRLSLAIGSVLTEIDRQLISPTLRRHPELLVIAEEMKIR
jgi:hypothetical protein